MLNKSEGNVDDAANEKECTEDTEGTEEKDPSDELEESNNQFFDSKPELLLSEKKSKEEVSSEDEEGINILLCNDIWGNYDNYPKIRRR